MYWTVHLNEAPNKDRRHAAVTVGNLLYSIGGDSDRQIGVYVFNTVSLCWRKIVPETTGREPLNEAPDWCWGHTAVLIEDIIYIWGGYKGSAYCNILYAFDVETHRWFRPRISGTVPEARYDHSACAVGKAMYIFGGWTQNGYTNDIYNMDTTTMVWSLINTRGTPAPGSSVHSATVIGKKLFVCGGMGGQAAVYNNIGVFDTETNCWLSTPAAQLPEARCGHSAFAYKGELYIFGGHNEHNRNPKFNDLWQFNPETFSWKNIEPKGRGPCSGMWSMCCCMVGDRVILFGGSGRCDDLCILDFSPSLKTLCKTAVIQYGLQQWELPHDIRWELAAMT